MFNNKVYSFGDCNQCEPVEAGSQVHYHYQLSATINQMCRKIKYIERTDRYDKETNNMLDTFLKTDKISPYFEPIGKYNENICSMNTTRIRVNTECCDRFVQNKKRDH